jgi:hypothetical protein
MATRRSIMAAAFLPLAALAQARLGTASLTRVRKTAVSIKGPAFHINGNPTYPKRSWEGKRIEGLLPNSRMVQGIYDDENPETRALWAYPDGPFDADRNTREFVAAMPQWRQRGLLGFTINLQGGSPRGYSRDQPWINSAFDFQTGAPKPAYMGRLEQILEEADKLGMVPIVSYFYFAQSHSFADEQAVLAATDAATDWLLAKRYTNVLVEIANECNVGNHPAVIKPARAHELIVRVQQRSLGKLNTPTRRLLVSTSYGGKTIPGDNVVAVADFLLLHGNGVGDPAKIGEMVTQTRALQAYRNQPILFNEDDHFDFDRPMNNFTAAIEAYASWGYFDYRLSGETALEQGYQSVPVDWGIRSDRKRGFFDLVARMTGAG